MAKLAAPHHERHRSEHIGWLRASVLGANDGLISTSALLVGIASANATPQVILLTGVAALTAGALSMAAGEYVSVSSQADTEAADTAKERLELESAPEAELAELTHIYVQRGLDKALAQQVAQQLTAHDALGAHLRDELGISQVGGQHVVLSNDVQEAVHAVDLASGTEGQVTGPLHDAVVEHTLEHELR